MAPLSPPFSSPLSVLEMCQLHFKKYSLPTISSKRLTVFESLKRKKKKLEKLFQAGDLLFSFAQLNHQLIPINTLFSPTICAVNTVCVRVFYLLFSENHRRNCVCLFKIKRSKRGNSVKNYSRYEKDTRAYTARRPNAV